MSTQSTAAPVRTEVVVQAPVERAFDVFTQEMMSWWPPDPRRLQDWAVGEIGQRGSQNRGPWRESLASGELVLRPCRANQQGSVGF